MFSGGFDNIAEDDFDFDEDEIADEEFLQLFLHGLVSVCLLTCPLQSLDVSRKKSSIAYCLEFDEICLFVHK